MAYGIGPGLADGVKTAGQFLLGAMQQRSRQSYYDKANENQAQHNRMGSAALLTKAGNANAAPSAPLPPGQALALSRDAQAAAPAPGEADNLTAPENYGTDEQPQMMTPLAAAKDVQSQLNPSGKPFTRSPEYGSEEAMGQVIAGGTMENFRKQAEDVGNAFVGAQHKYQEVLQKQQAAEKDYKMAYAAAATKFQGNETLINSDPHIAQIRKHLSDARIDVNQAKVNVNQFGRSLQGLLPGLDLSKFITMDDIGKETYSPNPTPAQFLTPGNRMKIQ